VNPLLTKLGIRREVQEFFQHSFKYEDNILIFPYGKANECFSIDFHHIPVTDSFWSAGDQNYHNIREIIICSSAMEAIAFLTYHFQFYRTVDHLFFISLGILPKQRHFQFIQSNFKNKKIGMAMGSDFLGRVADLKMVAGILNEVIEIYYMPENMLIVNFRGKKFDFSPDSLTLNSLEKRSGFRSHFRTFKVKTAENFLSIVLNRS